MEQNLIGRIMVEDMDLLLSKGLYESESKVENHFLVSSIVEYSVSNLEKGTYLDYVRLSEILKTTMNSDMNLLEDIANSMILQIRTEWPFVTHIKVKICKLRPDIESSRIGSVGIEFCWNS